MNEGQRLWIKYVTLLDKSLRQKREGRSRRLSIAAKKALKRSANLGFYHAVEAVTGIRQ